jgi:serine/threonine protein kinase
VQPQNLLLDSTEEDARLMLADFGFATKLDDPKDLLDETCGTLM